jgi:hypothetical protein
MGHDTYVTMPTTYYKKDTIAFELMDLYPCARALLDALNDGYNIP